MQKLKTNWQIKRLDEIESISFLRGNGLSKSVLDLEGESGCILYGELYTKYPHPLIKKVISRTNFKGNVRSEIGDVLVPGTTTADAYGIAIARSLNEKGIILGGDINVLRTNNKEILADYLAYFLNGPARNELASHATGTNIMHLSNKKIQKIEIAYPPIQEQKQTVEILDRIFDRVIMAKQDAEKNLLNTGELFESYLQTIFRADNDWDQMTLEEVSLQFGRGKSKHRPRNDKRLYGDKYPFIQTGDIRNSNHFITEYTQMYSDVGLRQSKLWPKGTICITIAANIAETGILGFDACFPDSVIGIVVDPQKTTPDFVEYLLQSYRAVIRAKGKGSAQANINMATFEHQMFPFPPLEKQKQIVKELDILLNETKKLEEIYKEKLADLEELKGSLLNMAFSGELSPAVSPVRVYQPSVVVPSPYVRNQVHAAIVDQVVRDGGSTTEVAVAKYDHLLQELFGLSLGYQFQAHQFGPFDAQIKRLVLSGLGKNRWFTKRSGMIVFGSNVNALLSRQSNLYHSAQASMKELARLGITKLDTDGIELLSTICHSIKETGSVAFDAVRGFMSQWQTDNNTRTKAEKFTAERTQKCLDFILKNNLQQKLLPIT